MTAVVASLAILLAVLLFPAGEPPEQPDGRLLYQRHCAVCHGSDGGGGVGIPLNLPDFLAVASDEYIRLSLQLGRPGRVMPAFPALNETEIEALVDHMRGWSDQPRPQYTAGRIIANTEHGEQLYAEHCLSCHGKYGEGGSGTGVTFSRPRGAPVMPPALNNDGFQRSVSDAMLKATLLRGRRGTPMPSINALGLSDKDADDLVAYLRTLKTEPAYSETADLEPVIRFDSSYDLEQTLTNLKQAVIGRNFRIIREQYLESALVPEGKESRRQIILYFCNFAFLNDALAMDPRVGLFLPCRVTLVETDTGVFVTSINPKSLSRLFNNKELDKACQQMHDLYADIMEEATL